MCYPILKDLPQPPPGKTGWPWTEKSSQLPPNMPDGSSWPQISIVTPSYNQGQFIEETIRSVLLQGYPNLEYIVIDGGSTDGSVDLIRNYEPWLRYWVSEPDRGQAHALNKGFAKCTGDLLGWINSDDLLLPEALSHLAAAYLQAPQAILLGDVIHFWDSNNSRRVARQKNVTLQNLVDIWKLYGSDVLWNQPGTYIPRRLYQKVGGLDENLRYVFDRDWMCRLLECAPVYYSHELIACFRMHLQSKTVAEMPAWVSEEALVTQRHRNKLTGFSENFARAQIEMYSAHINLSVNYWNRKKGLDHLRRALAYDWRSFLSVGSLRLCLRALSPLSLLRLMKQLNALKPSRYFV